MTEAINTSIEATNEAATAAPLTKEQKIAKIEAQIAKLQQRITDLVNGVVRAVAAKKEVPLPNVGDVIEFTYGRKTATSNPLEKIGTVVAIKPSVLIELEGGATKRSPAQLKVQCGDGFDAEFVVIYPAQVKQADGSSQNEEQAEAGEAADADDQS